MNFLQRAKQFLRSGLAGLNDSWYYPGGFFYGGIGPATKSGVAISETNAMQLAVVWCCIKVIAEDIASLPLILYRRKKGGGKERATDHPLYFLLHDSPNPDMTAFSFREAFAAHVLSWGNGYAEKVFGKGRIGSGVIEALYPITPNRVKKKRNDKKEIVFEVNMTGTQLNNITLSKASVLHVPGLSYDGLIGYSPIAAHREAIGLGKALEEYGELYFGNGIHPSFVVSHKNTLKDQKAFRDSINEVYGGLGKAHRVLLLEEAMQVEKLNIPNDDAQFLETRKYTNIDIGTRIYRLPPQMYGEFDKASTYASAEQFDQDYDEKTLRPWLIRMEQSFNMSLLNPDERREYFFEHLMDGLKRADSASRADFYTKLFGVGGITPNQICEIENWNPIGPEGDKRFVPLNYIPLDEAGTQQDKQSTQQNSLVYKQRLENAYSRLFIDAVGRVTRKESQRVNWLRKNNADVDEFYREFPDYIKKQAMPIFISLAESLMTMESELNGVKFDDFKTEMQRFLDIYCTNFSENYIETSRNLLIEGEDFIERDAESIAKGAIVGLSCGFISHFQTITGVRH